MNDTARLAAQMTELGLKFVERTRGEAAAILALIEKLGAAQEEHTGTARELGYLVHRIRGGGATFGFEDLSVHAGAIEQLIDPVLREGAPVTLQLQQQLRELARRLHASALAATP